MMACRNSNLFPCASLRVKKIKLFLWGKYLMCSITNGLPPYHLNLFTYFNFHIEYRYKYIIKNVDASWRVKSYWDTVVISASL